MNSFELNILDFIQKHLASPFLDKVMPIITRLGDKGLVVIIVTAVLLMFKKNRKIGLTAAISIIIGFLVGNLFLKTAVARIRPYDLNNAVTILINRLSDYSFPSGHTLIWFEFAASVWLFNKKFGTAAVIIALLVAFSRLYLYVHYPTDILASIVLGISVAIISKFIVTKFIYKNKKCHS